MMLTACCRPLEAAIVTARYSQIRRMLLKLSMCRYRSNHQPIRRPRVSLESFTSSLTVRRHLLQARSIEADKRQQFCSDN